MSWYVILNTSDEVIAVYGSALEQAAQQKIDNSGYAPFLRLAEVFGDRPHIGQKIEGA